MWPEQLPGPQDTMAPVVLQNLSSLEKSPAVTEGPLQQHLGLEAPSPVPLQHLQALPGHGLPGLTLAPKQHSRPLHLPCSPFHLEGPPLPPRPAPPASLTCGSVFSHQFAAFAALFPTPPSQVHCTSLAILLISASMSVSHR